MTKIIQRFCVCQITINHYACFMNYSNDIAITCIAGSARIGSARIQGLVTAYVHRNCLY